MPTVPQVLPQPRQPVYQTARGAGEFFQARANRGRGQAEQLGALSQALGDVSDAGARIVLQRQAEDNEREAKELENRFIQQRRELLYGQDGFYSKQQTSAIRSAPNTKTQLQELKDSLAEESSNDRVREAFDTAATSRIQSENERIDKYTMREREKANMAVSQTRVNEAKQEAAVAYRDDEALSQQESVIFSEVAAQGEMNGWAPEVVQSKIEAEQTEMYRSAVSSALNNGHVQRARSILEENQHKIDEPIALELDGYIQDAESVGQVIAITDQIMAENLDPREALAAARAIPDPETRKEVVKSVNNRIREEQQLREVEKDQAANEAFQAIYDGQLWSEWAAKNPDKANRMTGDGSLMSSVMKAEENYQEGRVFARWEDGETLAGIRQMETQELANVDLTQFRPKLTEQEWSKVQSLQAAAQKKLEGNVRDRSLYNFADGVLADLAPPGFQWNSSEQEEENANLQRDITNQLYDYINSQSEQGNTPTNQEIMDEANRLMTPLDIPANRSWYNPFGWFTGEEDVIGRELRELSNEEKARAVVPMEDIPVAAITDIERIFRDYGIEPTEHQIEQFMAAEMLDDAVRQRSLLGLNDE